eukprot:COSAG02_NODE_15670_length_1150_cov_1.087536_1_plen_77_part_00
MVQWGCQLEGSGAVAANQWEISDIKYVAHQVDLDDSFVNQIDVHSGDYEIRKCFGTIGSYNHGSSFVKCRNELNCI